MSYSFNNLIFLLTMKNSFMTLRYISWYFLELLPLLLEELIDILLLMNNSLSDNFSSINSSFLGNSWGSRSNSIKISLLQNLSVFFWKQRLLEAIDSVKRKRKNNSRAIRILLRLTLAHNLPENLLAFRRPLESFNSWTEKFYCLICFEKFFS